jgi:hypothetical protein
MKYITLLTALFALFVSDVNAKGFGGSRSSFGGGSRSSSSWSSKPSTPKVTPAPKPQTPSKAVIPSTQTKPKTAFDTSQQRRSVAPPKPKEEFVKEFKTKNAGKYPTTFPTQPAQRPNYIPPNTFHDGQIRNIEYNQSRGGYGFFDTLGQFIIFDALTDMAFGQHQKETIIYQQAQQAPPQDSKNTVTQAKQEVKKDEGFEWGWFFICLISFGLVGWAFYLLLKQL